MVRLHPAGASDMTESVSDGPSSHTITTEALVTPASEVESGTLGNILLSTQFNLQRRNTTVQNDERLSICNLQI